MAVSWSPKPPLQEWFTPQQLNPSAPVPPRPEFKPEVPFERPQWLEDLDRPLEFFPKPKEGPRKTKPFGAPNFSPHPRPHLLPNYNQPSPGMGPSPSGIPNPMMPGGGNEFLRGMGNTWQNKWKDFRFKGV